MAGAGDAERRRATVMMKLTNNSWSGTLRQGQSTVARRNGITNRIGGQIPCIPEPWHRQLSAYLL